MYRRYHYLSADLNKAARCFELYEDDVPVAFMAVLHQPTKQKQDLKRVSRLVVLPDYQGIGIGRCFLDAIAWLYVAEGHMFEIKTSARNLIGSLKNHPETKFAEIQAGGASWRAASWGFSSNRIGDAGILQLHDTHRTGVKTATFVYKGAGCPPFGLTAKVLEPCKTTGDG